MNSIKTIACTFIDVCSPDYLQDHHNRDNEALLYCVPTQDKDQVISELLDCSEYVERTWNLDEQKLKQAVVEMVEDLTIEDISLQNQELGILQNDINSEVYLYAYLSW